MPSSTRLRRVFLRPTFALVVGVLWGVASIPAASLDSDTKESSNPGAFSRLVLDSEIVRQTVPEPNIGLMLLGGFGLLLGLQRSRRKPRTPGR